ncbi:MAG: MATE family efflux transporter [Myxococcota bacterium]|nr:MATE family efflux transporter [Myxococcota bacterium]
MTDLTTRDLVKLAVPSVLFAVLTHAYRSVDQFWIQGVSTAAQGALGASAFVIILFAAIIIVLSAGASPLIARAAGANDPAALRRALGAGLSGVLGITVFLMVAGVLGADLIAHSLGLQGEIAEECAAYLRALSWTIFPLVLVPLVDQAFIAIGNARLPMTLHAISLTLNIALTPLFIYDLNMGIGGAALASNLSRAATTFVGFFILWRRTGMSVSDVRGGEELRRVLRIGFPVSISVAAYTLVYWAMLVTSISRLGEEVNAALGIGFSALEGLTWPCFHGLSLAVSSFVGRSIGAGRPDQAVAVVRKALPLSTAMGVVAMLVFFFFGPFLTGLFTEDPLVHEEAIVYTLILAFSQPFVAWEALFEGCLLGAGDTRTVFWLSAPVNLLRIPLAWALAFPLGWGAGGIWWAINITTVIKAALKGLAVRRGKWKTLEI